MTFWERNFKNHEIWNILDEVERTLKVASSSSSGDEVERFQYVVLFVKDLRLRQSNQITYQVRPAALDQLANILSSVLSYLQQARNGESSALKNAVSFAEEGFEALALWPPPAPKNSVDVWRSTTEKAIDSYSNYVRQTERQKAKLKQELEEMEKQLVAYRTSFEELRAQATQSNKEILAQGRESLKESLGSLEQDFKNQVGNWSETSANLIVEIENRKAEADRLVHSTSGSLVATEFGRYARNKAVAAWITDIFAAGLAALGTTTLIYHLFTFNFETGNAFAASFTRFALSIAILGLAVLVAKRATFHHKEAKVAKRTDLTLRQVLPFVANLDEEEKRIITQEITDRIFIKGDLEKTESKVRLVDRLKAIKEAVKTQEKAN